MTMARTTRARRSLGAGQILADPTHDRKLSAVPSRLVDRNRPVGAALDPKKLQLRAEAPDRIRSGRLWSGAAARGRGFA
jgi:hypothetical protein